MSVVALWKIPILTRIHPIMWENTGHDLVIMSSPKMLTPNEYDVFFSFLENTVMKNAY